MIENTIHVLITTRSGQLICEIKEDKRMYFDLICVARMKDSFFKTRSCYYVTNFSVKEPVFIEDFIALKETDHVKKSSEFRL